MHIIDSFKALLDSGESLTIHQLGSDAEACTALPHVGKSYVSEHGDIVYEMISGEFVVMRDARKPLWARRLFIRCLSDHLALSPHSDAEDATPVAGELVAA